MAICLSALWLLASLFIVVLVNILGYIGGPTIAIPIHIISLLALLSLATPYVNLC